jgi:DNA-binding PadR family transcriptional regulator
MATNSTTGTAWRDPVSCRLPIDGRTAEYGVMRSNLELFVLALIQRGLGTPYDFRLKAGLSVGSTSPALKRLEDDGLITGSDPGARASRRFTLTAKGSRVLNKEWESHLNSHPTDLDSIVRIAYLAWEFQGRNAAAKYLQESSTALYGLAASRKAEAERLSPAITDSPVAETFLWLRTRGEAMRLEVDATLLKDLAEEIGPKKRKAQLKA